MGCASSRGDLDVSTSVAPTCSPKQGRSPPKLPALRSPVVSCLLVHNWQSCKPSLQLTALCMQRDANLRRRLNSLHHLQPLLPHRWLPGARCLPKGLLSQRAGCSSACSSTRHAKTCTPGMQRPACFDSFIAQQIGCSASSIRFVQNILEEQDRQPATVWGWLMLQLMHLDDL